MARLSISDCCCFMKKINGKRQEVKPLNGSSISLTHAKSLLKAYIGSHINTLKNLYLYLVKKIILTIIFLKY